LKHRIRCATKRALSRRNSTSSSLRQIHFPHTFSFHFFFTDTAPTEIYTLSLHDALPIRRLDGLQRDQAALCLGDDLLRDHEHVRSEEHTSELQSRENLVCRLLLEKKENAQQWRGDLCICQWHGHTVLCPAVRFRCTTSHC